jgi:hypothetical protein
MKSFTKWLFFVTIAGIMVVLPLQAQVRGDKQEKDDKGKSGQGIGNERHDGDSKEDKGDKRDARKDDGQDKDGKKDDHHDGESQKDGCDKPAASFTVTIVYLAENLGSAVSGPATVSAGSPAAFQINAPGYIVSVWSSLDATTFTFDAGPGIYTVPSVTGNITIFVLAFALG